MNLKLRVVADLEDARALLPFLERAAAGSAFTFRENEVVAEGAVARFLERAFDRPETLVLVAEAGDADEPAAVCLTAPLADPLTGAVLPVVSVLFVAPDLRHRGVARSLVREAGRVLRGRGLAALGARASHNDDALISMGERWGFVRSWELMVRE